MTSLAGARRLLEPATGFHAATAICLAGCLVLLIEAAVVPSQRVFLLVGLPSAALALWFIHGAILGRRGALDQRAAELWPRRFALPWDARLGPPGVGTTLLYFAGLLGLAAAYGYLALVQTVLRDDLVLQWGWLDKRPLVLAYLVVPAVAAFHWSMVGLTRPAPRDLARVAEKRNGAARLAGALVIAVLAHGLIDLPALGRVNPAGTADLARFYDVHSHVHLSAFEQIRLGAQPYIEAQTQYGLGNQLLLYGLTGAVDYSNHGFHAANIALNAGCVVLLFVFLQQALGFGWALAALVGWVVWPSPDGMLDFAGWMILTRWLAIPVLALVLARLLLEPGRAPNRWLGPLLAGAVWGLGGFFSQENLSGGVLVLGFALALFGLASGRTPTALARFFLLFVSGGVATFLALVASSVGLSHAPEVLRLAGEKSGLVLAGISNSIWSEELGLAWGAVVHHGRLTFSGSASGPIGLMLLTYGAAVLLAATLMLLAAYMGRRWRATLPSDRPFVWKFGGVALGAFVLHLFTLMRCDETHLRGPSLLLPLFLLALPLFPWRYLEPGRLRRLLLAVSLPLAVGSLLMGAGDLVERIGSLGSLVGQTKTALAKYRALKGHFQEARDPALRYSPLPEFQAPFRNQAEFADMAELIGLLHARIGERKLELGFYRIGTLIPSPELFYFLGGFRSVSGITSPMNSIWIKPEETAWIDKVLAAPAACVFFEPEPKGPLYEAWRKATQGTRATMEPIAGRRLYGQLACKAG